MKTISIVERGSDWDKHDRAWAAYRSAKADGSYKSDILEKIRNEHGGIIPAVKHCYVDNSMSGLMYQTRYDGRVWHFFRWMIATLLSANQRAVNDEYASKLK